MFTPEPLTEWFIFRGGTDLVSCGRSCRLLTKAQCDQRRVETSCDFIVAQWAFDRGGSTENPTVRPARTSLTGWPFVRACRTPTSKDRSSCTCQISPPRPDTVSDLPNSFP